MKFRKKPVEIDAVLWDGADVDAVMAFIFEDNRWRKDLDDGDYVIGPGIGYTVMGTLDIPTLEGVMTAQPGDWIIRGIKGELYPCKPDIFEATYEAVKEDNNETDNN